MDSESIKQVAAKEVLCGKSCLWFAPMEKIIDDMLYVMDNTSEKARLIQLAEEAGELIAAIAKYLRILDGGSPTPVPESDAYQKIIEESTDVAVCLDALSLCSKDIYVLKMKRWHERIKKAGDKYG